MAKPRKKQGNPDFRHRVTPPAPPTEEIEARLFELLTELNEQSITIVLVTHEPDIAAQTKRVIRVQDCYVVNASERLTSNITV